MLQMLKMMLFLQHMGKRLLFLSTLKRWIVQCLITKQLGNRLCYEITFDEYRKVIDASEQVSIPDAT